MFVKEGTIIVIKAFITTVIVLGLIIGTLYLFQGNKSLKEIRISTHSKENKKILLDNGAYCFDDTMFVLQSDDIKPYKDSMIMVHLKAVDYLVLNTNDKSIKILN